MRVLFFPQNKEQVENMIPIANELCSLDYRCTFYDTVHIYKQELNLNGFEIVNHLTLNIYELSFYKLNFLQRIIFLIKVRTCLKLLSKQYDLIVFGNDGSIQRMINYEFRKANKKTILLLDGLISDYSFSLMDILRYSNQKLGDIKQYVKYSLSKILSKSFSNSRYSPYLPSIIGAANVNIIFTIGRHSKEVIEQYANKDTQIYAYGLPRMINEDETHKIAHQMKPCSICYFTGAYKWHGLFSYDKYQHDDIKLIINILNELKNDKIKFYIRVHPRENKKDYQVYVQQDNVYYDDTESAVTSLTTYYLLLTQISTLIVQGFALNKTVYSVLVHFPFWKVKNSFIAKNNVKKINEIETLKKKLEGVTAKKSENIKLDEHEFVSETTKSSVKLITNRIVSLVDEV